MKDLTAQDVTPIARWAGYFTAAGICGIAVGSAKLGWALESAKKYQFPGWASFGLGVVFLLGSIACELRLAQLMKRVRT